MKCLSRIRCKVSLRKWSQVVVHLKHTVIATEFDVSPSWFCSVIRAKRTRGCGFNSVSTHGMSDLNSASTEVLMKGKSRPMLKRLWWRISGWLDCSSSQVHCCSAWGGRLVWRHAGALCVYSADPYWRLESSVCHWRLVCSPPLRRPLNG